MLYTQIIGYNYWKEESLPVNAHLIQIKEIKGLLRSRPFSLKDYVCSCQELKDYEKIRLYKQLCALIPKKDRYLTKTRAILNKEAIESKEKKWVEESDTETTKEQYMMTMY